MLARQDSSLRSVIAILNGQLPDEIEWTATLATANRGWLGPALYVSLSRAGKLDQLPTEVLDYLKWLHDRNLERNVRLRSQLEQAVSALNGRGIEPVLLKGAIQIFSVPDRDLGARMTSDLDISIDPADDRSAREALGALGYASTARSNELGRAEDVGTVELHGLPNRRSASYLDGDLRFASVRVERAGAAAWIPSPTARALHLIVHDMIKDGDLWRFKLDLRHLRDLAELAAAPSDMDWQELAGRLSDVTGSRALEAQAFALRDLFGTVVPDFLCTRRARMRHRARLVASGTGARAAALRVIGKLSWGIHRMMAGYRWSGSADLATRVCQVLTAPERGSRL